MVKGISVKLTVIVIVLLMQFTMVPFMAMAAKEPSFALTISPQTTTEGQQVNVSVIGSNLTDVYGFELQMSFDDKLLRYEKSASAIAGFSVPPKDASGDKLLYAHTKIGKSAGESGTVELAIFTFTALDKTAELAVVTLDNVKLVNSDLKSTEAAVNVSTIIPIQAVEEAMPIRFTDLNGHWANNAIVRAATMGIVNGYADGTFRPDNKITRAEFTAMITRAFELKAITVGVTPEFADAAQLPGWARTAIAEASAAGIITGYSDHTFRPNQLITRTEMAVIIVRVLELPQDASGKPTFADSDSIPAWARPSIAVAVEAGIIKGSSGNQFLPKGNASRAEAVTVIAAGLDYLAAVQ
ncbi:S-layer homology domain-containing protein [Paenibacillus sp. PR3]|uniref:S-layer homology domain-containing protein n=1 Tax=Paenibacillus terricola TaxID=2763503 RepID=A0ABR8N0P7_9BACL|nr:S-layer homology domain-containing protein [Paenibacillus terricola]MBD3921762.1 S-layer homology domain-containing protein [Paenibacillus terricola]